MPISSLNLIPMNISTWLLTWMIIPNNTLIIHSRAIMKITGQVMRARAFSFLKVTFTLFLQWSSNDCHGYAVSESAGELNGKILSLNNFKFTLKFKL